MDSEHNAGNHSRVLFDRGDEVAAPLSRLSSPVTGVSAGQEAVLAAR
jgi:hypothetical protein